MSRLDETRLQQLLDRAEISDVQLRYATCIDTLNWELFRTCFTDELEVDFSSSMGLPVVHVTADEWVENTKSVLGVLKATQHVIANHVITLDDDDHATCVAGVRARHHEPNSTGDSDQTAYGYYTNRFERTSSGWRMSVLKMTATWSTGNSGVFAALSSEGSRWCGLRLENGTWQRG
jgi:SnoaL-like protein